MTEGDYIMSARYQTTDILASPQQVWTQIRQAAENHTILYEKAPEMLIVQRENQLHYIYYLTADPELTQLRLILTHYSDVVHQATQAADVWQWITTLPDEDISATEQNEAQIQLEAVKNAIQPARTQHTAPWLQPAKVKTSQAVPFPLAPMVLVGSVGGIGGVFILLILNWFRLGFPRKAIVNGLIMLVGGTVSTPLLAGFVAGNQRIAVSDATMLDSFLLLWGIFIIWQLVQQQAHIEAWTRRTGIRPTWYRAGGGTVFLAAVGGFVLYGLWITFFSFM
jgi:hypothetical protein